MKPRHMLLAALLAAALAASFWPGDGEDPEAEVVGALDRRARLAGRGCPEGGVDCDANVAPSPQPSPDGRGRSVSPLPSGEGQGEGGGRHDRFTPAPAANLFPAQSFRPPPKPVAPALVPPSPPPTAPPLPFTFVGAWTEDGRQTVFLERGGQLITAHGVEILPGGWRLDAVGPEGLTFTYVSLNQQRTLRIGP